VRTDPVTDGDHLRELLDVAASVADSIS